MAVSRTLGDMLVAAGVLTDASTIPVPIQSRAEVWFDHAVADIERRAPDALPSAQNAAAQSLFNFLYWADDVDAPRNAYIASGAAAILGPHIERRAGISIEAADD